jgi:serine/threonine-protein phosphatase Stp1
VSVPLYIHGRTDVGRQRERNEDHLGISHRGADGHLLVVCDGMGGHGGGDVASRVAVETIIAELPAPPLSEPPAAIYEALRTANVAVITAARNSSDPAMGTTAVVAWIEGRRFWAGWVGDSRLYHFRAGGLIERSIDHTRVQKMVELGILTPAQAREHPDAHILTQAIGGGDESDIRPSAWNEPQELRDGDVLLLCSDGLYDLIEDAELYPLIEGHDYQVAVDRLIALANERGGTDNITVILCVVGQPTVVETGQTPEPVSFTNTRTEAPVPGSWMARSWVLLLPLAGVLALGLVVIVSSAGWFATRTGADESLSHRPPPPPPPVLAEDDPEPELPPPSPPPAVPEVVEEIDAVEVADTGPEDEAEQDGEE